MNNITGTIKVLEIDLPPGAVLHNHQCCEKYWLLIYESSGEFIPIIINLETLTCAKVVGMKY